MDSNFTKFEDEFNDIDPNSVTIAFADDADLSLPDELQFNDIDPNMVTFVDDEFAPEGSMQLFHSPRDLIISAEKDTGADPWSS